MATTYSAFFSSGFSAARNASTNGGSVFHYHDSPPSPLHIIHGVLEDVSDIEMDMEGGDRCNFRLSAPNQQHLQAGQPRLRKRRSSTSLASTPLLNAIKTSTGKYKSRSRSGSVNTPGNGASESNKPTPTSRARSSTISAGGARPKRTSRRLPKGPSAPPPSCPLPELPPLPKERST